MKQKRLEAEGATKKQAAKEPTLEQAEAYIRKYGSQEAAMKAWAKDHK
jgi:hypothetical protein